MRVTKEPLAAMLSNPEPMSNLDGLKKYVVEALCEQNQLEFGAFPVSERILVRGDIPCGLFFCLHGPRAVKFTAIWETERNTILFYGATGERIHKARLIRAPRLEAAA